MQRVDRIVSHLRVGTNVAASSVPSSDKHSGALEDHVAIITGSGQGIGEATAKLFAEQGCKVVVTDIDAKKSAAVAEAINVAGGVALAVPGDITDKKFPQKLVDETIRAFGKLNILINNAGYTWDGMLHKITDEQWDAMLMVHNTAPFRIVRAAAPYLRDAGKAEIDAGKTPENRCIINISSTSGLHGNTGQANYSTAKMGVVGFTKTIAKEWGPFGVRCNAIAYGWIETRLTQDKNKGAFMQVGDKKVALGIPGAEQRGATGATGMIPLRRAGKPLEAAGAMLMLAAPYASYVTGHTLEVTGGAGI